MTPLAPASGQHIAHTPTSSGSLASICRVLEKGTRFLVTSHARPDGDAIGSSLALAEILQRLGKQVDLVLADPIPQVYLTLPGVRTIRQSKRVHAADYDYAVILECDSKTRTGLTGYDDLPVMNIDHHATGCNFGSMNWIDCDASAVAVLVYRIAQALTVPITPAMATCLYTALFTDTGAFTYPGTAAGSFPIAQELIALGANADTIARDVLYSVSAAHIRLLGMALARLQIHGVTAWSYISQDDLSSLGASEDDSEGTVNYLISIAGVEAAVLLREIAPVRGARQRFRVSLRSKTSLNVAEIATWCGGGGHQHAAGCTVDGPLEEAVTQLLQAIERQRGFAP